MTASRASDVDCLVTRGVPYVVALTWQRGRAEALRGQSTPCMPYEGAREALALIEHESVYTMGRRGGRASMLLAPEAMPAPVVDIERGGDLTWHGPGQLVGYPILDLRSRGLRPADYVRALESVLIEVLGSFGLDASTIPGRPGVWTVGAECAKVAAVGVAIRGGVSSHGFALNVAPDLAWYDAIVPCGLADASVTSMAALLPETPSMPAVIGVTRAAFERRFSARLVEADASPLRAVVTA